jgi:hypothetical protein
MFKLLSSYDYLKIILSSFNHLTMVLMLGTLSIYEVRVLVHNKSNFLLKTILKQHMNITDIYN